MNDITFMIVKIIVGVCSALITAYVIPFIQAKAENEKYENLVSVIDTAVMAAEQMIQEPGQGKLKKEQVLMVVQNYLEGKGISITEEQLCQLIEAAVYTLTD